jgi:hypothetical protein
MGRKDTAVIPECREYVRERTIKVDIRIKITDLLDTLCQKILKCEWLYRRVELENGIPQLHIFNERYIKLIAEQEFCRRVDFRKFLADVCYDNHAPDVRMIHPDRLH